MRPLSEFFFLYSSLIPKALRQRDTLWLEMRVSFSASPKDQVPRSADLTDGRHRG